jgi:hypothetical protein
LATTFTLLSGRELTTDFKTDGSEVRVGFVTDQGAIELASTPEGLWNLASKMSQLAAHATAIRSAAQGHQLIHVAEIAQARADTPKGAPIVALGLTGTTGSVQHFGLTPETSAALRQQMEAAEQQALDNRRKKLQ